METETQVAIFGSGCFWCTAAIFAELKGVIMVTPGYTGGRTSNPTYQQVCSGNTGHVEADRIEYDPGLISYNDQLEVFFYTHDPTTPNYQGNDHSKQYHSTIFFMEDIQKDLAEKFIDKLNAGKEFNASIVTTLKLLGQFYEAEDYQQGYYCVNAGHVHYRIVIASKLAKLRAKFKNATK